MATRSREGASLPDLDLTKNGLKLVTLTFGINLYTGVSFYSCREAILDALDLFMKRSGPERIRFYATETMRAHKPVTKRVLAMPETWLKPGAPKKDYVAIELKSGEVYQDAPEFKYHLWAVDKSKQAKILSLAFPAAWASEKQTDMLSLVQTLSEEFPFTSGLAGYSFERSPYDDPASETHAWTMSMRHRGIDIVRLPDDAKGPGTDGVKGVGWLTLIGNTMLTELGGLAQLRRRLSKEIDVIESKHGVIVKAGPVPLLGDVNRGDTLPLYRQVYGVVASRIEIAAERSMVFRLGSDRSDKTHDWYRRLSR